MKEFFDKYIRLNIWDGRIIGIPFLFGVVGFNKTGMKSQEIAEIINGRYKFILS